MKSSSKEAVKQFLANHPEYNHRKWQYHISGLIAGVTPEQAEVVSTVLRRIRDVIPNNETGVLLAQEWRIENGKDHIFDHIQERIIVRDGVTYRIGQ